MPSFASRAGGLICAFGAALVLASYGLPWITYRVIGQPDGTIESITWTGWGEIAWSFPFSLLLFGLPLFMALISASIALWLSFQGPSAQRRPLVVSLAISILALVATSLLLLWVATPDTTLPPEPTTLPGIGLLWLYLGYLAMIAGGVLLCLKRPGQVVPQSA